MTPAAVVFVVKAGATHATSWENASAMQVTLTRQDVAGFRALSILVREQRAQGQLLLDVRVTFGAVVLCSPKEEPEEVVVKVLEAPLPEDRRHRTQGGCAVIDDRFVEFVARDRSDDVKYSTELIPLDKLEALFGPVCAADGAAAEVCDGDG